MAMAAATSLALMKAMAVSAASFALSKAIAVALSLLCLASAAAAEIYKVGNTSRWAVGENTNYNHWTSKNTFHVGDTISCEYNKQQHNVLQVSKEDYDTCNMALPIATHASGNDSISIDRKGHYYFICGFHDHCGIRQKLDIQVSKKFVASLSSSSPTPAQKANRASDILKGVGLALALVSAVVVYSIES